MRKMLRLRRPSLTVTVKPVSAAPDVAALFYKRDLNHLPGLPYIILYWLDREILEISLDSLLQVTFDLFGAYFACFDNSHPRHTQDGHGNGPLRPGFA